MRLQGQDRPRHRGRPGHRPRERAGARRRRRAGVGHRRQPEAAGRYDGVANVRAAAARRARQGRHPARWSRSMPADRRAVQLRRRACTTAPSLQATDDELELRLQPQRARAVLDHPGRAAAACWRSGRRQHHQHGQRVLQHQGPAEPLRLRHHQGGGDRPDQERGRRLRGQRHPLQCDVPGHGRHAFAAASASTPTPTRWPRARPSSRASRWAGWRRPRRSRRWWCSWPATNRCSSPARPTRSTAASRYEPARFQRPPRGRHRRRHRPGLRHRRSA